MKEKNYFHNGAFVNPFTDSGFKIIFGSPESKPVLIALLNELLRGEHEIEDLTYIDKEDRSDSVRELFIMYDLLCTTSTGEYVIVEMQNQRHKNFLDRALVYVCRAICRQNSLVSAGSYGKDLPEMRRYFGDKYSVKTVYGIFLMNFKDPGLEEKFRTDVVLTDRETGRVVNSHLRQIFLQFPYFDKEESECDTLYDRLIYAIKNMESLERMPARFDDQILIRLADLASKANLSMKDRMAYEEAADRYYYSMITKEEIMEESRKEGLEEGLKKGLKRGLKKGREQGREEGRAEGREEGRAEANINTARRLKQLGVPAETIKAATGLSDEEIRQA